ncbi:histidine kinase [Lachnospiraceae bacterium OttesenSCG-928-J05]|nr:histidine kinase [Lachnospiraceae bacterium OttesenSCG-928-J05]
MSKKRSEYMLVVLLVFFALLCLGLWQVQNMNRQVLVESDTGTFDLRELNLERQMAQISRTVEYVPGAFLSPEEFAKSENIQVGNVPEETGICTMRIRVLVPDNQQYGISGYSVNYASSLYLNGKWLFDEGKIGLTAEEEEASESFRLFSAEPHDGVIEILIQTSSYANIDSSSGMSWKIGDYEYMRTSYVRQTLTAVVVMAWDVILMLIGLLLLLVLPSYRVNGWLALLAVVWGIRTSLTSTKPLLTLLPFLEWSLVYKLEIITGPLTLLLLVLIYTEAFPGTIPKWLRLTEIGICVVGVVAVIVLPWRTFLGHTRYTNQLIHLLLGVLVLAIILAIRGRKIDFSQKIMLAGAGLAIFAFVWDTGFFRLRLSWLHFSLTQPLMVAFSLFLMTATILATVEKLKSQEAELTRQVERQKSELMESRVSIMISQIQPHFLYNSLLAIQDLCSRDPQQAEQAIGEFSKYLRVNLNSLTDKRLIPFTKELEHVRTYLSLEERRYEERLQVEYDILASDFMLPALTIQPIVENGIQHGIMRRTQGGRIRIRSWEDKETWRIAIEDDGVGFDPELVTDNDGIHVGIKNVRHRLEAKCGGSVEIKSELGKGTQVVISLPKGGV